MSFVEQARYRLSGRVLFVGKFSIHRWFLRQPRIFEPDKCRSLKVADKDIPLALLYSVAPTTPGSSRGPSPASAHVASRSLVCYLEASFGIPTDHGLCPPKLNAETDLACVLPYFTEAMETMSPVVIPIRPNILRELGE